MNLRRVAANYDRRTPEIRVYPYGTCRAHPERVCVIVRVQDFGNTGWWGHSDADSNGSRVIRLVACHEHGTGLSGSLPGSWDHLDCQSWDHPARLAEGSSMSSLTARVMSVDAEVVSGGVPGGQRG